MRFWADLCAVLVFAVFAPLMVQDAQAQQARMDSARAGVISDALKGRAMASGKPYDPAERICVHRMHAIGTRLAVHYKGHLSICTVADRGPYTSAPGRSLDVSKAVAKELGAKEALFDVTFEIFQPATH